MGAIVGFARGTRHPDFGDAPAGRERARDPDARALIEISELSYKLSRPFAAPPGVPSERGEALRRAFAAVHSDPQNLEDPAKLRLEVSPIGGPEVLQEIERIAAAPPAILEPPKKRMFAGKTAGAAPTTRTLFL